VHRIRIRFQSLKNPLLCICLFLISSLELNSQQLGESPLLLNFDQVPFNQLLEEQIAYAQGEAPFGSNYASWCEAWVKHFYSIPCKQNPLFAASENRNEPKQEGPVFFLSGTLGGTIERTANISKESGIFFPVLNYVASYPCPYAGFKPAPGQSLKDFLLRTAAGMVDQGSHMSVTLDGVRITDLLPYRVTTEIFYFTALPELTCLDGCITGELQPGLADGYWIMLRPLSVGKHILQYTASYPKLGWVIDVKYNLTIE